MYVCTEMPVIPLNKVVNKNKIIVNGGVGARRRRRIYFLNKRF
jgi:hypothetical protein